MWKYARARSDELFHYGVKGMKWGVRRTPEQLGHSPKVAKAGKRVILKEKSSGGEKGIRSLEKRIAEHEAKLATPERFYPEWASLSEEHRQNSIIHWKKELQGFKKSIEFRNDELKNRGE